MSDSRNLATCSFFQHVNASAKYFIFKGLQNSSLPEGPKSDTFHGIHKALEIFLFSATKYALLATLFKILDS